MLREASRYVLVQVLAYGIDYGGFALGLSAGLPPLGSNVLGKVLAGVVAFALHRRVTFRASQEPLMRQVLRYGALLLLNLPLSSALLYLLLQAMPPYPAKILSDVACVGFTFLLSRHLVFARTARP